MVLLPYKRMAKIKEKEKALKLRQDGNSIADIAEALKVSKSTVSMWCRDISLSKEALQKIVLKSKSKSTLSILNYTESLRKKRIATISNIESIGAKRLGKLTDRDVYCIGLGIYWGEGYKKGSQEFGFTNSDPQMIKFYIKWLKIVFNVQLKDLILRVSVNQCHKNRITEITDFWCNISGAKLDQFTKPSFIKSNSKKIYTENNKHYGTLRIKVRKGTNMRREVLGALKSISS